MIYITGDYHLMHNNILRLCNRPFPNIETHDLEIISRNNEVVSNKDTIWDLGDISYRSSSLEKLVDYLNQLNGKRKLLLGNHDTAIRKAYKKGLLDKLIKSGKLEVIGGESAINDPSLIVAKFLNEFGHKFVLSHYAYRTWPHAFRGTIHLYGHSHGNLPPHYASFDVGVDSNNFRPWSLNDILKHVEELNKNFSEK